MKTAADNTLSRKAIIEEQIRRVCNFGNNVRVEYNTPYQGKHGKHLAEIYSTTVLGEICRILDDLKLKKEIDYLTSSLELRCGPVQIILKTEQAKINFEKALQARYESCPKVRTDRSMAAILAQSKAYLQARAPDAAARVEDAAARLQKAAKERKDNEAAARIAEEQSKRTAQELSSASSTKLASDSNPATTLSSSATSPSVLHGFAHAASTSESALSRANMPAPAEAIPPINPSKTSNS